MLQIKSMENFKLLRKSVDRKAWRLHPPTAVNVFYELSQNQISNIRRLSFYTISVCYF